MVSFAVLVALVVAISEMANARLRLNSGYGNTEGAESTGDIRVNSVNQCPRGVRAMRRKAASPAEIWLASGLSSTFRPQRSFGLCATTRLRDNFPFWPLN